MATCKTTNGVRFGVREDPEGTSGRFWAVAPKSLRLDDILAALPRHYFEDPAGYQSAYPGGRFATQMRVRRSRTRVLLTQFVGLDV